MKFVHLSDLHIGKRVNEYSMLEDQRYILNRILSVLDAEKPDCVLIAGDVYDKSVPSAEAVQVFDDFLVELAQRNCAVFVISGNHDSPERIAFGGRLMRRSGIHMSPVYRGRTEAITLEDEYGPVHFYLLPFLKPAQVRAFYGEEEEINSYTDAMRVAISKMELNTAERNILITHQFVTGSERTESEELSVGGADNVDVAVFRDFDYTALGHLHRPQNCSSERVRYCGTPLKYSFSEGNDQKSVTVGELRAKGDFTIHTVPLVPLRDMHEIRGKYDEIMLREFYQGTAYQEDYVHITLTDEEDIPNAIGKLRTVYHNLMKLDYDNRRTGAQFDRNASAVENKTPLELFADFYAMQNGHSMSEEQRELIQRLTEQVWERERAGKSQDSPGR